MTNAIKKALNMENKKQFNSYTNVFCLLCFFFIVFSFIVFFVAENERINVHQIEMEQK